MAFAQFMASPLGRGIRIVVGLALIAWGLGVVGGVAGWVIALVGLLPLTLGVVNGCFLARIFGGPPSSP